MKIKILCLIFLLLASFFSQAEILQGTLKSEEHEKLKSPRATMHTFIKAMDDVKNKNKNSKLAFREAMKTFNLINVEEKYQEMIGRQVAEHLINSIDRITKIDYSHIPDTEVGEKWYFRKQSIPDGENTIEAEIAIEKNSDGAWRFSSQTIETIGDLYGALSHLNVVNGVLEYRTWKMRLKNALPRWASEDFFALTKGEWLGLLATFIVSIVALSLIRFFCTLYIRKIVRKQSLDFKESEHYRATLPFGLLGFFLVWMGSLNLFEFDLSIYNILMRAFYILIALSSVWSSLKIVDLISMHYKKVAKDTANKFDDALVPMLSKTAKVLVLSLGTILVAHSLTFDIASVLAGLGIGGVAVALAAKDTISNLFGSVTVIIDRPFLIGDYVLLDKNLEGTIEEVGFRSTRIRTPYQSLVTLPNNLLANMAIDNYGMRPSRRFKTILQLDLKTPVDKLEEFCERLKYLCQIHQMIENQNTQIFVNDISDHSINILFVVFFKTKVQEIELDERHKMLLEILKLSEAVGVKFFQPLFLQGE